MFNIEYPKGATTSDNKDVPAEQVRGICDQTANGNAGFSTVLKNMNLDGWVGFCDGSFAVLT